MLAYSAHGSGCETPTAGHVKLNGAVVWQGSFCGNLPNPRGINILEINPITCSVEERRHYNTHEVTKASDQVRGYLQRMNARTVIVGVTADEPTRKLTWRATSVLYDQFGLHIGDVGYRGSFAFIAQKVHPSSQGSY